MIITKIISTDNISTDCTNKSCITNAWYKLKLELKIKIKIKKLKCELRIEITKIIKELKN